MSQPTVEQIIQMYGMLELPVTENARQINAAYNALRPQYRQMIEDDATRGEGEQWFQAALTLRDDKARQDILERLYEYLVELADARVESLRILAPDVGHKMLTSIAEQECHCDTKLAEHFVARYLQERGIHLKTPALQCAVIGPESVANLRLADTLRGLCGKSNIRRKLDLEDMLSFAAHTDAPHVIFLDLLGYDLNEVTATISEVRRLYPTTVFVLYLAKAEYAAHKYKLPGTWATRFAHYLRLYKTEADVAFEPIVRRVVRTASRLAEAVFARRQPDDWPDPVAPPTVLPPRPQPEDIAFICYLRQDWDRFVAGLVEYLAEHGVPLWTEQELTPGGEVWMDKIGEALDRCKVLIMVATNKSLQSPYTKMACCYFVNHGKPIVPLLLEPDAALPADLKMYPTIDASGDNRANAFATLLDVLSRHI